MKSDVLFFFFSVALFDFSQLKQNYYNNIYERDNFHISFRRRRRGKTENCAGFRHAQHKPWSATAPLLVARSFASFIIRLPARDADEYETQ